MNIKYCDGHKILFSQIEKFSKNGNLGLAVSNITKKYFQSSAKFQFERLFLSNFVPAPSSFINAEYFKSMNYFDESYKMVEDYPFWLQSTYNGVKLGFFDDVTVRYRVHEKSTSTTLDVFYNVEMHKFDKIMFKNFIKYNHVKCCLKIYRFIILLIQEKTIDNGNNLEAYNKYAKLIYLNPCAYLKKLRHFIKSISNNLLSRDK